MEKLNDNTVPLLGHYLPCSDQSIRFALNEQAAIRRDAPHKRLGELLLEHQLISAQELAVALRAQRVDRLRNCSLFAGFPAEALASLANVFEELTVDDGELLAGEGAQEGELLVLTVGEAEVFRLCDEETVSLGVVNVGEAVWGDGLSVWWAARGIGSSDRAM